MSAAAAKALCTLIRVNVVNFMNFVNFQGTVGVESVATTDWASITFSGARHRLLVRLEGSGAVGAAAQFLDEFPALEFDIPGHILADLALVGQERDAHGAYAALELEALTIQES
jgi:hypothetical protein